MALSVCVYFHAEGSWAALKEVQFEVLPRYAAMAAQRIPHLWLLPLGATLVYLGISTVVATVAAILLAEKRGFVGLRLCSSPRQWDSCHRLATSLPALRI